MIDIPYLIVCVFLFTSIFFEVFILLTFLENKDILKKKKDILNEVYFPTATIVVPCFNEEESISGTVESLLALDYPKDKYKIMVVDDGSTDNSWRFMQRYKNHPMIEIFTKKNGGKHTVLNFAINKSKAEIIGCLDADSFVDQDALKHMALYFADPETMAVTAAIKIHNPDNILRKIQKVEYDWGIFLRKMLACLNAMYVTPGPFSFFRKEVFEKLGPYKEAHNTEDMELAMRLQNHGYKITNCHNAFVHTIAPKNFKKLFTQRVRWQYGFFKNMIDYKHLILNRSQGNLGFFVLPMIIVSAFSALWLVSFSLFNIGSKIWTWFLNWKAVNFYFSPLKNLDLSLNWFYFNTSVTTIAGAFVLIFMIVFILISKKLADGKIHFKMDMLYFFFVYPLIAPTWLIKATYNVLISKKAVWR
jgi:cellulose synthase/poly-beta-1,6-N-acetylglucosamine synthase-like glycosyltransferase